MKSGALASLIQSRVLLAVSATKIRLSTLAIGAVLIISVPGISHSACLAPPSGLVSWWSGDDTTYDLVGFNHGVFRFGVGNGANYTNGVGGRAFNFDGGTNYIQTTTWGMNLGTLDFSIVGWAKTTATKNNSTLLMFDFFSPALYITGPNGTLQLFPANGTTVGGFNDGQFHHFAVSRKDGVVSYFKDGVLIGTAPYTGNVNQNRFLIGSDTLPSSGFAGVIDEVAFFERALSTNEIAAIHAAGAASMCKPPLRSLPFFIEAEDFDFNSGQHKAEADSMPYLGGAYAGLSATAEIDYHDPGANENADYRPASQGVAMFGNNDTYRDSYLLASNYKVAYCDPGDSFNYTRVFPTPSRNYRIYARLSSGLAANAIQLDEVVSGFGTSSQTLLKIGQARGPASGDWNTFNFVPVTDDLGNLVTVNYGGQKTIRVTILAGGNEDFNYLEFVPVDAASTSACAPSPSGLVAWWSGDGNPLDLQGTNHTVLRNGASYTEGKVGQSFLFDGIDDYVETPLNVQPSAMPNTTWECWVFPTRTAGGRFQILSTDDGGYDRSLLIDGGSFGVFVGFGVWLPVGFTPNQWQHIAVVYTTNNVEFYKNGVRFSFNAAPAGQDTVHKLQIGRNPGFGEYFQGRIDEVGIYNRALSAADIQAIYNAGSAGRCKQCAPIPSGLVSWYPAENSANDSQGINPGTLLPAVNGTSFADGKVGRAFSFDGVDDYISLGNPASLKFTGSLTIGAWINPRELWTSGLKAIVTKWGQNFTTCGPGSAADSYGLFLERTSTGIQLFGAIHRADTGEPNLSGGTVPTNVFSHVAMAYEAATGIFAIYINGAKVVSATNSPMALCTSEKNVLIGGEDSFLPRRFPGLIDEVQIFDRALSPSEIQMIVDGCKPDIVVLTNFLFVGSARIGESANRSLTISNRGPGTLTISNATFNSTLFSLPVGTFPANIASGTSRTVTLTFSPVNVGIAAAGLTLISNDPDQPALQIFLQGLGLEGTASGACTSAPPGLVSWWRAENSTNDSAGANHGILQNGATFAAPGEVGQAFSFDGVNDYVRVPASAALNVGTGQGLSIEAWINPSILTESPIVEYNTAGNIGVHLYHSRGAAGTLYANLIDTSGGTHNLQSTAGSVTANVFQHVALTYDKATGLARLYRNGAVVLELNLGNFTPQTTFDVLIGARPFTTFGPFYYRGLIDEASIYNRALATNEIAAIFNAGSGGKCTDSSSGGTCVTPAAWWPGDGNAKDTTQGGKDGTFVANTYAPGHAGQGFSFDGTGSGRVTVPNSASLDITGNQLTIDAWVRPAGTGFRQIVSKAAGTASDQRKYGLYITSGNSLGFELRTSAGTMDLATGTVPNDTFTHVAVTYDGSAMRWFINGTLAGSQTHTGNIVPTSTDLVIGQFATGGVSPFNGVIDELEIFNRALSVSEIQAIFNTGSAAKCNGLVWNLAEDFRVAPNQENPIRDRYNNNGVWYLFSSTSTTRNGNYTPFNPSTQFTTTHLGTANTSTYFTPGATFGIPFIGKNHSGNNLANFFSGNTTINWPNGTILAHPNTSSDIVAGWKSPINGTVSITGGITDQDNGGGNGVLWFIDKNSNGSNPGNLASGSVDNGGAQLFSAGTGGSGLANVTVAAGDFIYFVVDTRNDFTFDSTRLEAIIQSVTQTGGNCPTVSGITPTSGVIGSTVIISGANLTNVTTVKFANDVAAMPVTVIDDTAITVTVPIGAVTGPITISKAGCSVQTGMFTVGTGGDCGNPIAIIAGGAGNQVVVFPDAKASPSPTQRLVTGLPAFSVPQGVSYYGADNALIADLSSPRVFVVQVSTAMLIDTINTASAGYTGAGTIAVAPDASAALANGDTSPVPGPATSKLYVIRAPFNASSTIDSVTIPGSLYSAQTQGIIFNNAGRAFVYTRTGISALDPPYNSVAFTIPVSDNGNSGGIAITPDGNTLLATAADSRVRIFQAPFSASSTPHFLTMPSGDALDGIAVTPDGTKAIVAGAYAHFAAAISAPFSSASTVEALPLPTATGPGAFEDVSISADSQIAILAGGSLSSEPPVFIRAPFTAAGAQSYYVPLTGSSTGRGAGAARFQPACKSVSPTPGCPSISGINPTSGAVGSSVTISGTNFTGVTAVKFANNVAATITASNNTTLTVKVPSGAVTGPITISKANCSPDVQTSTFTISTSPPLAGPGLRVVPLVPDFGTVAVSHSNQLTLTLSNAGSTTLVVSNLNISNPRFTMVSPPQTPFNLPTGAQQPVTLRFSPLTQGAQLGLLTIGNSGDGVFYLPLRGVGGQTNIAPGAAGGTPVSWGDNYVGELGLGSGLPWPNFGPDQTNVPVAVLTAGALAGKTPRAIASGPDDQHSLLLTTDGKVFAWGDNSLGQLGNGTDNISDTPVPVTGALNGTFVTAVATDDARSFALTMDGKVYGWGEGFFGDLGNLSDDGSDVPVAVDMTAALNGKTVIAIGGGVALASDGKVYTWGRNDNGELGIGAPMGLHVFATNTPVVVGGALASKVVISVVSAGSRMLALTSDGKLFGWGANSKGQLGNGTTNNSNVPVPVDMSGALFNKTVVAVAAGSQHSLALTADGQVFAWGYNRLGQLGDGTTNRSTVPVAVDMTAALNGKVVVAVAAGRDHSLALTSEGKVYGWGERTDGQLGDSTPPGFVTVFTNRPVAVNTSGALAGRAVTAIAAGYEHSLAISVPGSGETGTPVPGLKADYQFQNTRASSGGSAPALVDIGSGANTFANDMVDGCPPRTVLNFPKGNGHSLATTGLYDYRTYSIVVLFKFTEQDHKRAIVNFKGDTDGRGVFADGGNNLNFINSVDNGPGISVGSGSPITANKYVQVVLTRAGSDANLGRAGIDTGYVDGVQQYQLNDVNGDGIIDSQLNLLRFFLNPGSPGDFSGGSVARIRIYDRVLSPSEVATLDRLPTGACPTSTPATCVGLPVAWWPGDGNAKDIQGANDGDLLGGATASAIGKVGQAFALNGTTAFVQAPDSPLWAFGTSDFTIDFWVSFNTVRSFNVFLASDEGGGTRNKWFFFLESGGLKFHINSPTIGGTGVNIGSAAFSPVVNQFYHVALTRAGNTFTFYVDGQPGPTATSSQAVPDAAAPLTIGQAEGIGWLDGRLDEIEIFNRALSASEIQTIINAGSAAKCPNSSSGGNGPDIDIMPASLNFGTISVGSTNRLSLAITNRGTVTLTNSSLSVSNSAFGLTVPFVPFNLRAGAGTNIQVEFHPGAAGPTNGSLTIGSNDPNERSVVIPLTGIATLSAVPNIVVAPRNLNFGTTDVNQTNTLTLAITNTGNATLSVNSLSIDNAAFGLAVPFTPFTLGAGVGTNIRVEFRPVVTGPITGMLTIGSSDPDEAIVNVPLAGNATNVIVQSSVLVAWGNNRGGTFGNGTQLGSPVPVSVVTAGALAGRVVVSVAGGVDHTIALTEDGKLFGWGFSNEGQVGDGTLVSLHTLPVPVVDGALAGRTVTAISAGYDHNLAVTADGRVFAWGAGQTGQLGNGTTTSSAAPVMVDMNGALNGKTVIAVAAGAGHSVVLTSEGGVYTWGDGDHLGTGTAAGSLVPVAVSTSGALNGKNVVAISADSTHTLALTSEGKVYAWGDNAFGELGNGTEVNSLVPVPVFNNGALNGKFITAISAGQAYSLALASDGTAFAWGANGANGQRGSLGDGTLVNTTNVPVAVRMDGALSGKKIIALEAGGAHCLALASDGKLYTWGRNIEGQLGTGDNTAANVPVMVNSSGILAGKTISRIAAGYLHNLVIIGIPPTLETRTISGRLATSTGSGLAGVTIQLNDGQPALAGGVSLMTQTDANGNYTFSDLPADRVYTLTPSKSGLAFAPASITVSVLTANGTVSFAGLTAHRITGNVITAPSGTSLSDVTVRFESEAGTLLNSALTDANGSYTSPVLLDGANYVVRPVKPDYIFTRPTIKVTGLSADVGAINFVGTLQRYTISGLVTNASGFWAPAVTLTLSDGASAETKTVDGAFAFSNLRPGFNYNLTPSKQGWTFVPPSITFNSLNGDQSVGIKATPNLPLTGKIAFRLPGSTTGLDKLAIMNADGTERVILSESLRSLSPPALSLDGQKIAANLFGTSTDLGVVNSDGSGLQFVNVGLRPAWSPNGAQLAFDRPFGGIFICDADGANAFRVTGSSLTDEAPSWSPDGRKLAIIARASGDDQVRVLHTNGLLQTQLTFGPGIREKPAWSAINSRIAFSQAVADSFGRVASDFEILVMDSDGNNLTFLTTDPSDDRATAWSPDGSALAFSKGDSPGDIFAMNANGSLQVHLGEGTDPSWGSVPTFTTAAGSAVTVGTETTSIQFSQVTAGGTTTINPITPIYAADQTPPGYTTISGTGVAFDIATTASYAQPLSICLTAPEEHANNLNFLFIAHHENGRLVVKPTTRNGLTRKLCAQVNSLSPFVILEFVDPSRPQITGLVVDVAGNPIPRVTLELSGAATLQTLSDINGKFTFADLTAGASYSVTPFDDRYDFTPPLALVANLTGTNTLAVVAQAKAGPALKIAAVAGTPGRFNLTWPVSPVEYVLESATVLNPLAWIPAAEQPSLIGNNFVVSVQATSVTRYFRLRRQ